MRCFADDASAQGGDVKDYFPRGSEHEGCCESGGGAGFSARRKPGFDGRELKFFSPLRRSCFRCGHLTLSWVPVC